MPKRKRLTPEDEAAARRLRRIWDEKRKELGMTQEKAAAELEITQGAVSHYLNGRMALGALAVHRFANLLGVEPDEIRPTGLGQDSQETLTPRQRVVLEYLEWLTEEEYDELLKSLDEAKQAKLRTFEFVRERRAGG